MPSLIIRDPATGNVVMDETDFISRHLMTIEIPFNDTAQHTVLVPGLTTGNPYYIFDPQSNIHMINVTTGMNTIGFFSYIEVSFSGDLVTYQHKYIASLTGSGGLSNHAGSNNVFLHIGVY